MRIGEMLVERGLVSTADIDAALERQRAEGGRLGENLIAMGLLTEEQFLSVIQNTPPTPSSLNDTGISRHSLLNLLLKFMHIASCETVRELADGMKLPYRLIDELLEDATHQKFVQPMGARPGGNAFSISYALSELGKAAAKDALGQNLYVGPAPVPLASYQEQIQIQRITNELIDDAALRRGFHGLVVPEHYLRKLLPAINAGRTVLLFGPPGNGKTTLATRIAKLFRNIVYIPHAVEVDGQIIKVFDPSLHRPSDQGTEDVGFSGAGALQRRRFDERWVACDRPVAVAGGEMTLEMLDLQYNPDNRFYDAPLHVKALNGMLLIDDFGRQKFDPSALLNRWIVPMENQIDFLRLNTGTSFSLPFDELVIFSTNLAPSDLMDPAFLRRIPYKIKLYSPSVSEYRQIFDAVAHAHYLRLSDEVFEFIVERLLGSGKFELAYYQPKFICTQALEICKCTGLSPRLTQDIAAEALQNLYFDLGEEEGAEA